MRTSYNVICNCGHKGQIILKENDTPYSANYWESYSLKDLSGRASAIPDKSDWETIFRLMRITCPKCNAILSSANLKE